MKIKKFKVRVSRKKGWDTYGYFKAEDEVMVRNTLNEINKYNQSQPEDSFYYGEYFKIKNIREETNRKNWKKRKVIREFKDWQNKNSKLKSFYKEKVDILVYVTLGFSLTLTSCIFLFGQDMVKQLIFPSRSLYSLLHIYLMMIGLGIVTIALKDVKTMIGEGISGIVGYSFFTLISILFLNFLESMKEAHKLLLLYTHIVIVIWLTSIVIFGILQKTYSIFINSIEDTKKRIEALIAIFGTIISLIALFK